jgi:hypothetical protein
VKMIIEINCTLLPDEIERALENFASKKKAIERKNFHVELIN